MPEDVYANADYHKDSHPQNSDRGFRTKFNMHGKAKEDKIEDKNDCNNAPLNGSPVLFKWSDHVRTSLVDAVCKTFRWRQIFKHLHLYLFYSHCSILKKNREK